MRWFDPDTGLWRSYWWQGASILTSFNDIAYLDSGVKDVYNAVWDQVYTNAPGNRPYRLRRVKRDSGFVNDFYDDAGWWALAWIGAYDNTGKGEYLDEAISIWNHINDAWGAHKCGGIPWKTGTGPLAIPNCTFPFLRPGDVRGRYAFIANEPLGLASPLHHRLRVHREPCRRRPKGHLRGCRAQGLGLVPVGRSY